jgi:hypothetical protein
MTNDATMSQERKGIAVFAAGAALLASLLLFGRMQFLTGDEPRYLIYATAFWRTGTFTMTLPDWQRLYFDVAHLEMHQVPLGGNGVTPLNSVYLPILLGPIALAFKLAGLRAVTLIIGIAGLYHLYRLCSRISSPGGALLATAVAGFTIPLLPYLHLFYMETFLFALVCFGWERLQRGDRGLVGDMVTAAALLAIPFVHLRGSVVAALLFLILLGQLYRRGLKARAAGLGLLAAAAFVVLVVLNLTIYGDVAGPVNTARPPLPWDSFPVLAMQLFNVRHGLLAYAPIWLIGYAGLLIGAVRGPAIARQAAVLALAAAITGVGVNPGECWPARFWILSIPMVAVGICVWWSVARRLQLRAIAVALLAFTLVNTAIFLRSPNDFLENRQTAATYQSLFNKTGHVHFGLILPVEVDDAVDQAAARNLAIGAAAFVVFIAVAADRRRILYAVPAVLLLAVVVDTARVRLIPPAEYSADIQPHRLLIDLQTPMQAGYIQFGRYWETWSTPPEWQKFGVVATDANGRQAGAILAAKQVVPVSCTDGIASVTVENSQGFDIASEAGARLAVYQSTSFLRRQFSALTGAC